MASAAGKAFLAARAGFAGRWTAAGVLVLAAVVSCGTGPANPGQSAAESSASPSVSSAPSTSPSSSASSPVPSGRHSSRATSPPATRTASPTTRRTSPPAVTGTAYVRVSVATVWRSPAVVRPVDQPALGVPANIRGWLAGMTLDDRRDLEGRADTQVLLDDRVLVIARSGSWAEVRVPGQPTPLSSAGYPGWVPLAQLSFTAPTPAAQVATVIRRTAWLYSASSSARSIEISFATRLPVTGVSSGWVSVALPGGVGARIPASDVAVTASSAPALPPTGADVIRTGQLFLGLDYLWAGASGFGVDCSGLTYLAYRVHGRTIPRDADAQAATGTAVSRSSLAAGDLVFFASGGTVHHVGIYQGGGLLLDAPYTGGVVRSVSLQSSPYATEYAGARRYLP